MLGPKRCYKWLKDAYRKAVNYICEECNKHEKEVGILIPHRLIRRNKGGTYKPSNVKMVCLGCHRKYHSLEFKI